ncbi:MAG: hypothetical protein KAQ90_03565 [Melioribacteraceae bacterium]|nr:hypothetical protein [Melioribacteraceae bacterium]
MKITLLLSIFLFITLLISCSDDDNGPTTPAQTSYEQSDLVGTWVGEAKNSSNTIPLNLTVDSEGKVSGSGVSSNWSCESDGKVTGAGSFAFTSGQYLTVAGAGWSLQLSSDKTKMTGNFNVAYSTLHNMAVDITKQ